MEIGLFTIYMRLKKKMKSNYYIYRFLLSFIFLLLAETPLLYSIEIKVYNNGLGTYVKDQTVDLVLFNKDQLVATADLTSDKTGFARKDLEQLTTESVLSLSTVYEGYTFYNKETIQNNEASITLNVYTPDYRPQDLTIKLYHCIISSMKDHLIFDVRLILENKGLNYFVSGNNGFLYPFFEGATLLNASPIAKIANKNISFDEGVRPGESIFSYTVIVPYNFKRTYELPVKAIYPIIDLLVIGDDNIDININDSVASIDKRVKNISSDINITYFTARNIDKDFRIRVIPVNNYRLLFIKTFFVLIFILVFIIFIYIKIKNRLVPSFNNLVENISNKERYDKEIIK